MEILRLDTCNRWKPSAHACLPLALTALAVGALLSGCAGPTPSSGAPGDTLSAGSPLPPGLPGAAADLEGKQHDLDSVLAAGRPVALIFWQTWCVSCLREAPGLAEAARRLDGKIAFYGVVSGPDEAVDVQKIREIVKTNGLPYPQLRDRDLRLTDALGVTGTPTIIVIGTDRKVRYTGHRPPESWLDLVSGAGVGRPQG